MEGPSAIAFFILILTSFFLTVSHAQSPWHQLNFIALTGAADDEVKLAVTTYDVSLAGFTNRTGHWHAFPEHADRIPRSTPLRFDNTYHDLIGGLANLPSLPLGREPMTQAISVLYTHDPAAGDDEQAAALKRALATLKVSITVAQRLTPIKEAVTKGWDAGDARVAPEHLPYVEHWDTICHEIIRAHKNGDVWDGPFTDLLKETAGIHGFQDALAVVGLIGNRTMEHVLLAHARSA